MQFDQCTRCGQFGARERSICMTVEHGGRSVEFQDTQTYCQDCGNVSYIGTQISAHELAISSAVRKQEGLLSAVELRRIRLKYRLTQTQLEAMLSTGPKTWTRWERGKVTQSKAADTLIRLISDDPKIAQDLMTRAGVATADAVAVFNQIEEDARKLARAILRREVEVASTSDKETFVAQIADKAFETVPVVRRQALERAAAA